MAAQDNSTQSYLSKLSPWAQNVSIPQSKSKEPEREASGLQEQKGADHVVSHRHRLSLRKYPRDCPPMRPQWFHAVDVPKRRPHPGGKVKEEKPLAPPKKYAAFSKTDSKAIEAAFQKLIETEDRAGIPQQQPNKSLDEPGRSESIKIAVNEDYLFDVDVEKRELGPSYWLGPVYDVRRGTWFYQDGSVQRPCDENLAAQLEEGYLKVKAWRIPALQTAQTKPRATSQPRARPASWAPEQASSGQAPAQPLSAKQSISDLKDEAGKGVETNTQAESENQSSQPPNTYRLFGSHMNSVVTYQDANTAWLLTDSTLSRMSVGVYERFAGGGHFAGMKMTRGYVQSNQKSDSKEASTEGDKATVQKPEDEKKGAEAAESQKAKASTETKRQLLQRQMSSLLESATDGREEQEGEMRRREEREIEDDYDDQGDQGREISHLILVTHGIGQRLGLRLDSVNFVHDVNTLRKTLKAVYADSPDLRALNDEHDSNESSETMNSRIQVLPICWRHLLDFPKQSLRHNRKEHDIADTDIDDGEYPTLEDITVDGVPHVRNLICDMGLDILIYDSPSYKEHIASLVLHECNRIYRLFMERNPSFNGKVSLIGHSLGSVILFDILCRQRAAPTSSRRKDEQHLQLEFEVEDFYALGSPIALYQMLGGRTIASRQATEVRTSSMDDPMLGGAPISSSASKRRSQDLTAGPDFGENPVSKPKCSQIYNIFHPTDPIAYRIEPLISPAMATLKPQPLPYTKRGIFGAPVGQGLTGIGARVSQSVSSMWSSVASSLLTRGLGYDQEPKPAPGSAAANVKSSSPLSMITGGNTASSATVSAAAGTNISSALSSNAYEKTSTRQEEEVTRMTEDRLDRAASNVKAANQAGHAPPTLIDNEIETLSSDFEKKRRQSLEPKTTTNTTQSKNAATTTNQPDVPALDPAELEARGKKLRREEAKVRRLNANGRVDYAIQEGAFDINLIAAIASHISYFSDEDVSHFMLSQLLSRNRAQGQRKQ
jgi:hypothetical protein